VFVDIDDAKRIEMHMIIYLYIHVHFMNMYLFLEMHVSTSPEWFSAYRLLLLLTFQEFICHFNGCLLYNFLLYFLDVYSDHFFVLVSTAPG
jgi:hypothetical protein